MDATSTVTLIELINATQEIASLNLGYLGICVTIVLASGGFAYFISFTSLQDKLRKQEDELKAIKKETVSSVEKMKTDFITLVSEQTTELREVMTSTAKELGETITATRNEVEKIRQEAIQKSEAAESHVREFVKRTQSDFEQLLRDQRMSELNRMWLDQYMWDGRDVHGNTIVSLIEFQEQQLAWKLSIVDEDLWVSRIETTLEKMKSYTHDDKDSVLGRLQLLVEKLADKDARSKIAKLIDTTFS